MTWRPTKPPKGDWDYHLLWRLVEGAVADTFAMHPEYLADGQQQWVIRQSICKRVVGTVIGYVEQSTQGRSGEEPAAKTAFGVLRSSDASTVVTGRAQSSLWLGRLFWWRGGSSFGRLANPFGKLFARGRA